MTDFNESVDGKASQAIIVSTIDRGERLISVHCIFDEDLPKGPVAIEFVFETSAFLVIADAFDDTISVLSTLPAELQSTSRLKIDDKITPWNGVVGSKLLWSWLLTNQRGYVDGIQLEFRQDEQGTPSCFQAIAIASTLELRILARAQFSFR
jgi:hypothetical protein